MSKFLAAIRALQHGASLADPAVWKQRQNLINAVVGLLGAVALFLPDEYKSQLTPDAIASLAGAVAVLVGLLNPYLTVATTDKLGLPDPSADRAEPDRPEPSADDDLYRPGN